MDGLIDIKKSRIVAVENMNTETAYAKIIVILANPTVGNNNAKFKEEMMRNWSEEMNV